MHELLTQSVYFHLDMVLMDVKKTEDAISVSRNINVGVGGLFDEATRTVNSFMDGVANSFRL